MIDVIIGATDTPVSTESLIVTLKSSDIAVGVLYTGYPILGTTSITNSVDALFITPQHGMVLFDIVEGVQPENRSDNRDNLYNLLYSKLIGYRQLTVQRGQLSIPINILTYAPGWPNSPLDESGETITDPSTLIHKINNLESGSIDTGDYRKYLEVIQAVTKLKSRPQRIAEKSNSKGDRLNRLEESVSNLDRQQSKAVIETTSGIQRIRGLAGSGKTIVLALKVAYLHSKYPDWDIGVTFYTRALKDQFRDYITKFTIEHKYEEPDWDKVKILQAWGGPKEIGLYYQYCIINNIEYSNYNQGRSKYGNTPNLLEKLCVEAIESSGGKSKEIYDMILVDEAQDFSESFLVLCYNMLRSHDQNNAYNKRLIYAYDELQKLSQTSLGNPKDFLSDNIDFNNIENRPKQDIFLDTCYRNSAPVLVTAHALGFGIYRKKGPVTMFKEKEIWLDVGYRVESGELEFGSEVTLSRNATTSPEFYKDIDPIDELIQFRSFASKEEQLDWVATNIYKNIKEEELKPTDIIVIHPDVYSAKNELAKLRSILFNKGIESHISGITTSPDRFFISGSVACTSIYRAKGNEAPMVYMINSEHCFGGFGLINRRNTLFTGITRSKAWVRVCGVGSEMNGLIAEFDEIRSHDFKLNFRYPTIGEMDNLNIIHRDLTQEEARSIKEGNSELKSLLQKLEEGTIRIEDLSPKQLSTLKTMLRDD